jgi:hypothetical protein
MLKREAAHKLANLLQVLMSAIENIPTLEPVKTEAALQAVRRITDFMNAHTASRYDDSQTR